MTQNMTSPPKPGWLARLASQPLVVFVLGAGLIFLWDAVVPKEDHSAPVTISAAKSSRLVSDFERMWGREPDADELAKLESDLLGEEAYYQEALALGLDDGDPVIRQYLINKMKYLIQDSILVPQASEDDLAAFYAAHIGDFTAEPEYTFSFIRASETGLAELNAADDGSLSERMEEAGALQVSRTFGRTFYERLSEIPEGDWLGPYPSAIGDHFVRVETVSNAPAPPLSDISDKVEAAWTLAKRKELELAALSRLREAHGLEISSTSQ
ncbi:MAG: hypothetical protein CMK09_12450 [Ponticaulis sp.]|nr:hypothetical protein [Ponticaulis sp.]